MIDIYDREDIAARLKTLTKDTTPFFGKMTAQHMVEHVSYAITFSNGKLPCNLYYPLDKALMIKAVLIYSDQPFPIGFKAPMISKKQLPNLLLADLPTAIEQVFIELADFDKYFSENEGVTPVHPVVGECTKQEWIMFHNRHLTHHFTQFGLI
jgi:hypothetical protein